MLRSCVSGIPLACLLVLAGCGGGDDGNKGGGSTGDGDGAAGAGQDASGGAGSGDAPADSGEESGRLLWIITDSVRWLEAIDTGSHKEKFDVQVAEGSTQVWSFKVAKDYAWVGRDDGGLVVVDLATEEVVKEIDLTPDNNDGAQDGADAITLGDGFVYATAGIDLGSPVVRIDAKTFEVTQTAQLIEDLSPFSGMAYDGTSLWVVSGNDFRLVQADPVTLEIESSIPLAQDPDQPGVFIDGWSYGDLVHVSDDAVWVIDTRTDDLLRVDKDTLTPSIADNLLDVADLGAVAFGFWSNGADFFLMLEETDRLVQFDGVTGKRGHSYDLADQGGASTMAVAQDRLYVRTDDSGDDQVLEVDIESGKTLQTINLPIWANLLEVQ